MKLSNRKWVNGILIFYIVDLLSTALKYICLEGGFLSSVWETEWYYAGQCCSVQKAELGHPDRAMAFWRMKRM